MAKCPSCDTDVNSPLKTWPVTGDVSADGTFAESKVGIYECSKCLTKFPYTFSKQKLEIVNSTEFQKLKDDLHEANVINNELGNRNTLLDGDNDKLRKLLELSKLQGKANALSSEVSALKRGRSILEDEISNLVHE